VNWLTLIFCLLVVVSPSSGVSANDASTRAVLVTGASSGIGLRITELLSANGFLVYAGARKEEDLKRLDAMENVESVRLDVTVQSDIDAAACMASSITLALQPPDHSSKRPLKN
jgi:nucleoside-diphosphate-sugar epimerase